MARRIWDSMQLEPNSAVIRHANANYQLANNPLGEDQVMVMAQEAAAFGGAPCIRKTMYCGPGGEHDDAPYSYVVFHLKSMIDGATLHGSI